MALIDKAALVSEIDKRLNYRIESLKAINNGTFWKEELEDEFNKPLTRCTFNAVKNELFELKCFLDTLEVKEVDLEKYYHDFLQKEWFGNRHVRTVSEMMAFTAKHFFELGIKVAQKGEKV